MNEIKNPQTYSTLIDGYDEAAALQELLQTTNRICQKMNSRYEEALTTGNASADPVDEQYTINIGGKSIAFHLGGPQVDALYAFIEHIAGENMYQCDIDAGTVIGWQPHE